MSRRSVFVSLCAMVFLVNLARIVFAPLLEPLRVSFGVSPGTVGLLATLAWFGSAFPRLFVGLLLTRVSRHTVVLGSGVVLTVSAAFASTAGSIEMLMVGAFAMGLASGAYFIAANPLVSELFPDRPGAALGIHGGSSQVAAVIAAPFVGLALAGVTFVGVVSIAGSWRTALHVIAVASALVTVATFFVTVRADLPSAGDDDRSLLDALFGQWRLIVAGIAFIGVTMFVYNGVFNFYVSYLIAAKSMPAPTARTLLTVLFVAGLPAFVISGRLADRLPSVPYILSIIGGFVASLLALTLVRGFLALVAVSLVMGLVIHSLLPAMDTYMLSSLPDHHRASAYTVYSSTMMMFQASGSAVLGQLIDLGFGYDTVFRTAGIGLGTFALVLVGLHLLGVLPTGGRAGVPSGAG